MTSWRDYKPEQPGVVSNQEETPWYKQSMNPFDPNSFWANTIGTSGTATDAFIRGGINAATFGLANKTQAAIRATTGDVMEGAVAPEGSWSERYAAYRDEGDKANRAAVEAHPGYYILGNLAGGVPQVGLGRIGFAGGAPGFLPSAVRQAAAFNPGKTWVATQGAIGATQGALQGAGETASDMGEQFKKIGAGATVGGLFGILPSAITSGVRNSSEKVFVNTIDQAVKNKDVNYLKQVFGNLPEQELLEKGARAVEGIPFWSKTLGLNKMGELMSYAPGVDNMLSTTTFPGRVIKAGWNDVKENVGQAVKGTLGGAVVTAPVVVGSDMLAGRDTDWGNLLTLSALAGGANAAYRTPFPKTTQELMGQFYLRPQSTTTAATAVTQPAVRAINEGVVSGVGTAPPQPQSWRDYKVVEPVEPVVIQSPEEMLGPPPTDGGLSSMRSWLARKYGSGR